MLMDAHGSSPLPHPKASQSAQLPWLNSIKTSKPVKCVNSKPTHWPSFLNFLADPRHNWSSTSWQNATTGTYCLSITGHVSKGWPARESRVKIHQISQFAKSHITKHSSYSSIRAKLASEIYGLATQMSGLLTGTTSLWCVVTPRGMRDELWAKS